MPTPTKYREEFCEQLIELGRKGYSQAEVACEFGTTAPTVRNWRDNIPEFKDAYRLYETACKAYFDRIGREGIEKGRAFGNTTWWNIVTSRFGRWDEEAYRREHTVHNKNTEIDPLEGMTEEQLQEELDRIQKREGDTKSGRMSV